MTATRDAFTWLVKVILMNLYSVHLTLAQTSSKIQPDQAVFLG